MTRMQDYDPSGSPKGNQMKPPNLFVACAFLSFLGACTQPLSDQTAQEFDALASAAASVAGTPDRLQRELFIETRENRNLCNYLRGLDFQLGLSNASSPVTTLATEQASAGKALTGYIEALVEASRGKSIADLESARTGFTTALGEFATAAGIETRFSDVAGQAFALVERVGESSRQKRIRGIMRDAIDPLFLLEDLLKRDVAQIGVETEQFARRWDNSARCVLTASRRLPDAEERLTSLSTRRTEIDADLQLIRSGPEAVRRLRIAHVLAVTTDEPIEEAFAVFVEILQEVEALVNAIEGKE